MAIQRLKIMLMLVVGLSAILACQLDQFMPQSQDTSNSEVDASEFPSAVPTRKIAGPVASPTRTPIPIRVYAIAKANVNVLAAPSANAQIIDHLNKGDALQVVGRTQAGDWWQVVLISKPNQTGWISAPLVTLNNPATSIPVVIVNALGTPQAPTATTSPKPGISTVTPEASTPLPSSQTKPSVTPTRSPLPATKPQGSPQPFSRPTIGGS